MVCGLLTIGHSYAVVTSSFSLFFMLLQDTGFSSIDDGPPIEITNCEQVAGEAITMADVDPDTLLEWLQMGAGDERDMQLIALEQLCMLLLMSDNVDRCFESCPPRTFLPALCRIFIDDTAPDNVLEVSVE